MIICLITLFRVSFSDPGILPSLYLNSGITSTETKFADNTKEYFVEYKSKQDLQYLFSFLNITDPLTKFYSLNKFKFYHVSHNQESDDDQ